MKVNWEGSVWSTFDRSGCLLMDLSKTLLHDITANAYHKTNVPNSSKHKFTWLTYSSLAQVCKYANRVSYQVLNQHSPRLTRGLPEREDSLEEAYWDR
jgi:inosine kinase